jgi:hypothetical protein
MNAVQRLAWLVSIGQQSMADRGVDALDGQAITAILDAAGPDHADQAALAIKQLTEV